MKIKLDDYRNNLPLIKTFVNNNKDEKLDTLVHRLVLLTCCPYLVIYCFLREIKGPSPEIDTRINKLTDFYSVDII